MEPIYRQKFKITPIHLDCFGRVKPSVLLYFAQEVAVQHSTELSVGWNDLHKRHQFWAVIRQKMQITRLPVENETITVETWPMPTTRVAYPRSTVAYDESGNEVFRAISLWVIMDTDTRNMITPGKSGIVISGTVRGTELSFPSSLLPRLLENQTRRTVGYTELDKNGHMNNTRYLDWIDDLLPASFHNEHPLKDVTICYLSEAMEGEHVDMEWNLEGDTLSVNALRRDDQAQDGHHRVFSAQLCF